MRRPTASPTAASAFARLRNKAAVGKLFSDIGPRFEDAPGGYTRILKARPPPPATQPPVAYIELVGRELPEDDFDDEEDED